jgi:hypothetical protein
MLFQHQSPNASSLIDTIHEVCLCELLGGAGLAGQEGMVSGTAVGGATCGKGVVRTPLLVSRMISTKNTMPRNTATTNNAIAVVHFG